MINKPNTADTGKALAIGCLLALITFWLIVHFATG